MARTVAPLLSFDAGGQIAKTQVYSRWKGRPYVRRYVVPANPNSAEQQKTRNSFKWLMDAWKYWPAGALDAWNLYAASLQITNRNAFAKQNVATLRDAATISDLIISPSARSGLVAQAMVLTVASGQITATLTPPDLPNGWTVADSFALAIPQQDPQSEMLFDIVSASDNLTPFAPVLTGLTNGTPYVVGGWFKFAKGDGSFAYGQSLQDEATPTP